jgi:hypothetical protein
VENARQKEAPSGAKAQTRFHRQTARVELVPFQVSLCNLISEANSIAVELRRVAVLPGARLGIVRMARCGG